MADREEYEKRDLWQPLIDAVTHAFWMRTESFVVKHLAVQGRHLPTGRALYLDYVVGSEDTDAILGHFLCPALAPDPVKWGSFFDTWVNDPHPPRVAHLLYTLKRRWEGRGPLTQFCLDIPLPESLERQLSGDGFLLSLIERVEPLALESTSPTWMEDFYGAAARRPMQPE